MQLQLPDGAVRDTIEAVFRRPEFARSIRDSLWSRFTRWLGGIVRRLFADGSDHPAGRRVAIALLITLGVLVAARIAWEAYQASERGSLGARRRTARAGVSGDPWAEARDEAASGRYVEAAHALYRALLEGLAQRGQFRLHPAKTAGDYVRDLRASRSTALPRFRQFARAYEVVAYGTGQCDRERYERLLGFATATLEGDTVARRAGAA